MRELTSHKVNGLNEALQILVTDEPGSGGASHKYVIHLLADPDPATPKITGDVWTTRINFQNGPIKEAGVNGISGEALLAVVEDRLKCFQEGPYKSRENALALTHIQEAMHWLHHRTRERMSRGVEGTHNK